ncbi:AraC family transcriptional regulator [Niallia nealsonii]|uniref:AraC family transcriptional regulator n=1 Tax=Niallia nealsonii TaxID=115979 RepID=A0A2N0Z2W7_9BACI|nr:helix-turn-helix domain-containing protein [Niallia nealsonii]PKG23851.1 AraC family transcriptional regulator [Niallia nealsonii]
MNHQQLDEYLRKFDYIEEVQIKTGNNVNDFDGHELLIESGSNIPRMQEEYFFHRGPIFINKHHRFADMPLHIHSFIEINYVYSGICKQIINEKEITLTKGQVCLLDTDVPHSIPALGKDDILINIIMKKETFSTAFWTQFTGKGVVSEFLLNALTENQVHDRYILFHSQDNDELQYTIKKVLCEFFDPSDYSLEIVSALLPVLFIELMRIYQLDKNFESEEKIGRTNIMEILHYIERNYKECTLTSLAKQFNFNSNYLGNMLKERTGKTFIELLQSQKMVRASVLLKNTSKSIGEIAFEIGYESSSFFHRKFKDHYGCTPNHYRKKK